MRTPNLFFSSSDLSLAIKRHPRLSKRVVENQGLIYKGHISESFFEIQLFLRKHQLNRSLSESDRNIFMQELVSGLKLLYGEEVVIDNKEFKQVWDKFVVKKCQVLKRSIVTKKLLEFFYTSIYSDQFNATLKKSKQLFIFLEDVLKLPLFRIDYSAFSDSQKEKNFINTQEKLSTLLIKNIENRTMQGSIEIASYIKIMCDTLLQLKVADSAKYIQSFKQRYQQDLKKLSNCYSHKLQRSLCKEMCFFLDMKGMEFIVRHHSGEELLDFNDDRSFYLLDEMIDTVLYIKKFKHAIDDKIAIGECLSKLIVKLGCSIAAQREIYFETATDILNLAETVLKINDPFLNSAFLICLSDENVWNLIESQPMVTVSLCVNKNKVAAVPTVNISEMNRLKQTLLNIVSDGYPTIPRTIKKMLGKKLQVTSSDIVSRITKTTEKIKCMNDKNDMEIDKDDCLEETVSDEDIEIANEFYQSKVFNQIKESINLSKIRKEKNEDHATLVGYFQDNLSYARCEKAFQKMKLKSQEKSATMIEGKVEQEEKGVSAESFVDLRTITLEAISEKLQQEESGTSLISDSTVTKAESNSLDSCRLYDRSALSYPFNRLTAQCSSQLAERLKEFSEWMKLKKEDDELRLLLEHSMILVTGSWASLTKCGNLIYVKQEDKACLDEKSLSYESDFDVLIIPNLGAREEIRKSCKTDYKKFIGNLPQSSILLDITCYIGDKPYKSEEIGRTIRESIVAQVDKTGTFMCYASVFPETQISSSKIIVNPHVSLEGLTCLIENHERKIISLKHQLNCLKKRKLKETSQYKKKLYEEIGNQLKLKILTLTMENEKFYVQRNQGATRKLYFLNQLSQLEINKQQLQLWCTSYQIEIDRINQLVNYIK